MDSTRDQTGQRMDPEDKDAPWELPDRQALSILAGDTSGLIPALDGTGAPTGSDAGGSASQAGGSAGDLANTAGQASGGGEESISEVDRSETISQSDSAYAES